MEHPELNFLIQREIHNDRIRKSANTRLMRKPTDIHPLRRVAGSLLITMGNRLASSPRPAATQRPIGGVALVGRSDR